MPIVEIALSVGFQTQAHFSTVFKRFTGNSPAQWRCNRELTDDQPTTRAYAGQDLLRFGS
jgi:AraC-like DNA-binding protein